MKQRLEVLSCISNLNHHFTMLLIQDACTLLGVYILLLTEISFLCVLSYTVYCVSNNKLCTCFVVFASLKSFLLSNGVSIRELCL